VFFAFSFSSAWAGSYPIGTFDAVDNNLCQVAGWVKDPDSINPTTVHVYKDEKNIQNPKRFYYC
jgi:hypothetical protein